MLVRQNMSELSDYYTLFVRKIPIQGYDEKELSVEKPFFL
jgi:hypothetical protein